MILLQCFVFLGFHFATAFAVNATGYWLTNAVSGGAVCLDGTPPLYYHLPGSQSNKWMVYIEGGGWCAGITTPVSKAMQTCYDRSYGNMGSSKSSTDYPSVDMMSNTTYVQDFARPDCTMNPEFCTWNLVFIRYCDGGSFSGNNPTPVTTEGKTLYFRGSLVMNAIIDDLVNSRGMKSATDVIVSGGSAGGLAVFLHLDKWRSKLPSSTKVAGLVDSGFFLDHNDNGQQFSTGIQWIFNNMQSSSGVDQTCLSHFQPLGLGWKCMFPEHSYPYIKTRLFSMQSKYDSWQIENILHPPGANYTEYMLQIHSYGSDLQTLWKQALSSIPNAGGFMDTCFHHCGEWGLLKVNGISQPAAVRSWYTQGNTTLLMQPYDIQWYNCK